MFLVFFIFFRSNAQAHLLVLEKRSTKTKSKAQRKTRNFVNLAFLPWNRWTDRGALVFADDLTVKPRTKLNNQGAHAMGVKFNVCAEKVPPVLPPTNGSLSNLRDRKLTPSCVITF